MNECETLKQAVDMLRPELPDLVGEPWPGFEAKLATYLDLLTLDSDRAQDAVIRIMALFSQHGRAYQRLVAVMAELQIGSMQSQTRDAPLRKPGARPDAVTRYVDITSPRRVSIATPRLAVVVRLTVRQVLHDLAVDFVALQAGTKVTVRIDAPNFELLGPGVQKIAVLEDQDSLPGGV